ncbi:MAG: LacI family DNA-binding transcriptional regulator [Thermomicrobiales bacterium]
MKDIAKRSGVSLITVSRVVNNSGYVGKATRARVEDAIRELNYIPNMVASSLRSRQSDLLALLLPDITNSFWTSIARGAEDEAWASGYGVFICNTDNDTEKEAAYIERLIRRRVGGVLFVPTPTTESQEQLARLRNHNVNFVIVHRRLQESIADVVRSDGETATRKLTDELIRRGSRRIAFVGLPLVDETSSDRLEGFRRSLKQAGIALDPELIQTGDVGDGSGGVQLVRALLDMKHPPDAILLANSRLAIGGLRAIDEAGLQLQTDIHVAAFHDINTMDHHASRLIRAVQPSYKMGQLATRRLLEISTQTTPSIREIILESEIHVPPS